MTVIVADIETWIDWDHVYESGRVEELLEGYSPPASYRKPLARAAHKTEEWFKWRKSFALSPMGAQICSLAWCDLAVDPDKVMSSAGVPERQILQDFADYLHEVDERSILCGYAIKVFDLPFITVRAADRMVTLPRWWPRPYNYRQVVDLMDYVPPKTKLDHMLKRFGEQPKTADNTRIEFMTPDDVRTYNEEDVRRETLMAIRFSASLPQLRDALDTPIDYSQIPQL